MEALICPQCGGQITEYSTAKSIATCKYCSTKFLINSARTGDSEISEPVYPVTEASFDPKVFTWIAVIIVFFVVGSIAIAVMSRGSKSYQNEPRVVKTAPSTPRPGAYPTPSPTPDPNLLKFGGKGTENGLFKGSNSIAVDAKGRIYVADDSLRVQQFDEKGNFLSVIQVPEKTSLYKKTRTIDKIAVDRENRLFIAVGGVIQVYKDGASTVSNTIHVAPDYVQDFALRSDGSLLMIADNDRLETLIYVNKAGKITRRVNGFHTNAAEADPSPQETAIELIRMTTDNKDNIYSIYAFDDGGTFTLSYDDEDMNILQFKPDATFVGKIAKSLNSCGIAVDSKGRIYVSDGGLLDVYSNTGEQVRVITGLGNITSFALGSDDSVYVLSDDTVIKRPAI